MWGPGPVYKVFFWGTCGIFLQNKKKKQKKTKKKRGFSAGFSQMKNCHSVEMNKSVNNENGG